MSVEARTWKISRRSATEVGADGPLLEVGAKWVDVVELEPVLDLLEHLDPDAELARVESLPASQDAKATWREAVDFLRTHGRLK